MKVVGKPVLEAFGLKHAQAIGPLKAWVDDTEAATWGRPQDIKDRYRSASFLADNIVIFNIGGNKYRLEVKVAYVGSIVRVLDVNTHADYDEKNKKRSTKR